MLRDGVVTAARLGHTAPRKAAVIPDVPKTRPDVPKTRPESPQAVPPSPRASRGERVRTVLLCLALIAATVIFLRVVGAHYPIERWLFWRYLVAASLAGLWAASCAAMGAFLLARSGLASDQGSGNLVFAFPVGVLVFQLAIFLLGLCGLLGPLTFFLLPLAFLALGASRMCEAIRAWRRAAVIRSVPELALVVFGLGGIALVYFQLLTPEPFSWDARWYHLPLAQQYALQGAVKPFPEGWWLSAYPHAASLVYTWAFLLPGSILFDRLELCAHLELAVFLATIASIPTLVRTLDPHASGRRTWVAIFLFPGVFLYDGNLHAGADHMAALWCIPLGLALIRVWRSWAVRDAVLFGAVAGAVLLSKYSAWSMLCFPACAFLVRAAWLGLRRLRGARQPVLAALLLGGATVLLVSAPHWLKNWLWYGDPMYPVFYRSLHVHPWTPESPGSFKIFLSFTFPPKPGWEGVKDALLATLNFSFVPNDWWSNHRDWPVFGSLFTLSMLCLPFVRAHPRLWLSYLGVMVTLVVWYLSNHQDRLLQAWLPFMAAATVATLGLVWRRRHLLVRALVVVLVAAQIVWGGDVPFFPTHNLVHDSPLRAASNFLASGFLCTERRLAPYGALSELGMELPPDARVLLHELNLQMGIGRLVVNDQWQGRISYETLQSPAAIYDELSSLSVTHMIWTTDRASNWNSIASSLAFLGFALNHADTPRAVGEYTLARLPKARPAPGFNDRVAVLDCGRPFANGIYALGSLVAPNTGRPPAVPAAALGNLAEAVQHAGFLVVDPACGGELPPEVSAQFHRPVGYDHLRLYVRKIQDKLSGA